MNVLLAVASKHGATHEIADVIAHELSACGVEAKVRNLETVLDPAGYDAAILGSAVYMSHLMPAAQHFVDAHEGTLAAMPVWLFASGQLGTESPVPARPAAEFEQVAERIGARGSRMFGGRLDNAELSVGERIVTGAVHAPAGDFRDWDAIRAWAREIADSLHGVESADASGCAAANR